MTPAAREIRNPKLEIRNKSEAQNKKTRNRLFSFSASDFGFVSDFEFRISDFPKGG